MRKGGKAQGLCQTAQGQYGTAKSDRREAWPLVSPPAGRIGLRSRRDPKREKMRLGPRCSFRAAFASDDAGHRPTLYTSLVRKPAFFATET